MILTKTPLRIGICGGGTDYFSWYSKHGGICVGGSINKYSYITARNLPPYHEFKHRIIYRKIETVNAIDEIEHAAARFVAKYLNWPEIAGLEISHLSDLPSRSGTGSSSTFVVGLLNAVSALLYKRMLPCDLAQAAMFIEQKLLNETVGCQDQIFAAYGGLNTLRFAKDDSYTIVPFAISQEHLSELQNNLMLFYTCVPRTSSEIAATYANSLSNLENKMWSLVRLAEDSIHAIYYKKWEKLGDIIDQSWKIKVSLSDKVANADIHKMYAAARLAGAFGGKLCGAGGGGSFLLVVPEDKQERVKGAMTNFGCVHIPFRFTSEGSQIIFAEMK